ncbi:hypothetical protein [Holospora elegans]|nr:hypothetical protein [Holospora elegans]
MIFDQAPCNTSKDIQKAAKTHGVKLGLCEQAECLTNSGTYRTFGKPQRI